jgi:PhzF family phenazine biosynthesis protein
MKENILRISAFSEAGIGGNPAGVVIVDELPPEFRMLEIAREVGYSETAFLCRHQDGWRIRYFSPEIEIPFCGHATIASGSALGENFGVGVHKLFLNDGEISVESHLSDSGEYSATLTSPDTWTKPASVDLVASILSYFNLSASDIHAQYPISVAFAGAKHLIIVLNNQEQLSQMQYEFEPVREIMLNHEIITVCLIFQESDSLFHVRNAFAFGGVVEDPATGAAAAFAGYLRDQNTIEGAEFTILQGTDMGSPSKLLVSFSDVKGSGIHVTGQTHHISE